MAYQDLFGGQIMIVLFTMDEGSSVVDLASGENRQTILDATEEIAADPNVESVVTPLTGLEFSDSLIQNSYADPGQKAALPIESIAGTVLQRAIDSEEPGSEEQILRYLDQDATACRLLGIQNPLISAEQLPQDRRQECDEPGFDADGDLAPDAETAVLTNPEWVDFLLHDNTGEIRKSLRTFFPDDGHAQMIVRLRATPTSRSRAPAPTAVKDAWADREIEGASIVVTGAPVLLKDINDYLRGGILTLGAIAVAIMIVILLVLFDVRWRLLPLAVVLIGVIWAFGLAGYLGIPLSVVTIAGLPVMLGVGIDYAIQMHARIEEEVIIDRASHPIQETARNLGPALLVVTFDALFAFAALRFAKVPMIRDFALLLCIGIAVICLGSIILPLATLGIREFKSPTKGRDFREGALGRLTVWLGSLPPRTALPLMAASLVIFLGGIYVEGKLTLQTDPVAVGQPGLPEPQGHPDPGGRGRLVQRAGHLRRGRQRGAAVRRRDHRLPPRVHRPDPRGVPRAAQPASSIITPIGFLTDIEGASDVVPTGEEISKAYEAAPDPVKTFTVADTEDDHALNILFTTRPSSLDERAEMVNEIRDTVDPPGSVRATPSGLAVVGVGLLENLESNRVLLDLLSIFFVFAFLTVRLKSLVRSLLSLVPVLIAVGDGVAGRLHLQPQAEPDDGRGRSAGDRRVHGVHVADPPAVPRGTGAGSVPAGGRRRGGRPHRPGLHRLGHDRHRRRGA